jgi:hypothetical protein
MSLRPQFLGAPRAARPSGSPTSVPIAVYINGLKQSGADVLRSISATKVAEVRYLEPMASLNQFGPSAAGGALVVTLYDPSKEPPTVTGFSSRGVRLARLCAVHLV